MQFCSLSLLEKTFRVMWFGLLIMFTGVIITGSVFAFDSSLCEGNKYQGNSGLKQVTKGLSIFWILALCLIYFKFTVNLCIKHLCLEINQSNKKLWIYIVIAHVIVFETTVKIK